VVSNLHVFISVHYSFTVLFYYYKYYSVVLFTLVGSPSWTMMRWYCWKKGRHCSRKSRLRILLERIRKGKKKGTKRILGEKDMEKEGGVVLLVEGESVHKGNPGG